MKRLKIKLLFAGALVAAAIAVTPLAGFAQQQQRQSGGPEIVLSQDQQKQIAEIRKLTLAQIQKVLSPAQMNQFKDKGPMGIQNLTEGQKKQLEGIFQSYIASIQGVLTEEQLQQIEQAQPSK